MRKRRQLDGMRREYLLREEEHLQRMNFEQMGGVIPLVSPQFIADFRFKAHRKVQADQTELLTSECSICLDNFEIGQSYARWPCPGPTPLSLPLHARRVKIGEHVSTVPSSSGASAYTRSKHALRTHISTALLSRCCLTQVFCATRINQD